MALTGFMLALPHSLAQISVRIPAVTGQDTPPAATRRASSAVGGEAAPPGSPRIRRSVATTRMTPGASARVEACTTAPTGRASARRPAARPPGSIASRRAPSRGPARPSRNHQGRPFMAVTSNGPWRRAGAAAAAASANA